MFRRTLAEHFAFRIMFKPQSCRSFCHTLVKPFATLLPNLCWLLRFCPLPFRQNHVASIGFMESLVADILRGGFQCAASLQINFDLLGEVVKYNPRLLTRLNRLLSGHKFGKFVEVTAPSPPVALVSEGCSY